MPRFLALVCPSRDAWGLVSAHGSHTAVPIIVLTGCPVGHHTAYMVTYSPTISASPPAPRLSFRQRLAARRLVRRAWSDLYADLDAQTASRLDALAGAR